MFDLVLLIKAAGYLGLFGIIFAESGLFLGFFLPGDSLLFTAGFLASQGHLEIATLIAISFAGAVLGDSFGYYFGGKVGRRIFSREDSLLFHKDHLKRAEDFYRTYGGKAIILARFLPVIRTFAPILAGVGKMHYTTFLAYNVVGAVIWGIGMPLLGFYLGNTVPNIDRYLVPIILIIILSSVIPTAVHILKDKGHRKSIAGFVKRKINQNTP